MLAKLLLSLQPKVLKGYAQVAKLVDALCSGRSVRKDVMVRIHSWAPYGTSRYNGLSLFYVTKCKQEHTRFALKC